MKRGFVLALLLIVTTLFSNATELTRDGWNLISICQDMNRSEIDMSGIEEVQSQDGKSIYTGKWEKYSNLDYLYAGYGYWVKGTAHTDFYSGNSKGTLVQPLNRDDWNLMASCEDIPAIDINLTEMNITEVQSQDGNSIYTGSWEEYSNLDVLLNGYGYWVKGDTGTPWTAKRGLSIPVMFDYQTINNLGEIVETTFEDLTIKLFVDYNETANSQANHTGIVVRINGQDAPIMQIQDTYRGHNIVAGVYDMDGNLVGVSDVTTVSTEGAGTFIDIQIDIAPPTAIHPEIDVWGEAVVGENQTGTFLFDARDVDSVRLADGTPDFITLVKDDGSMRTPANRSLRHSNIPKSISINSSSADEEDNWTEYRVEINPTESTEIGYYAIKLIGTNNSLDVDVNETINLFYGIQPPSIDFDMQDIDINQGENRDINFTLYNADSIEIGNTFRWTDHKEIVSDFADINGNSINIHPTTSVDVGFYGIELIVKGAMGGEIRRWIGVNVNPEGSNHRPNIDLKILYNQLDINRNEEIIATVTSSDIDGDNVNLTLSNAPSFIVMEGNNIIYRPDGTENAGGYNIEIYAEDSNGARNYIYFWFELTSNYNIIPFTEDKVVDKTFYMDRWYDEAYKLSNLYSLQFNSDYSSLARWYNAPLDTTTWNQSWESHESWRIDNNGSLIIKEDVNTTFFSWENGKIYDCTYNEKLYLLKEFTDSYNVNHRVIFDNCVEINDSNPTIANSTKLSPIVQSRISEIQQNRVHNSGVATAVSKSDGIRFEYSWSDTILFNQPLPYTKDELREQGYDDITINGTIELRDENRTINTPQYATIHIANEYDNWHPALGFNALINGSDFNQTEFLQTYRYSSGQMMNYQVYIDSNQNSIFDEDEEMLCSQNILFENINNLICNTNDNGEGDNNHQSSGELPLIIIRIEFNDYHFASSATTWHDKIFGTNSGELNNYYNEISYGHFQFKEANETYDTINDGIITVALDENHPGDVNTFINRINTAASLADNYIDFSAYDKNHNGAISRDELQIMYLVAGGESATGATPGIWAYQWCMYGGNAEAPTLDGVKIMSCYDGGNYSRFGEKHFDANNGSDASIGIIAHELGHAVFGLPDLYDIDGSSEGIGNFGLMGAGSWGQKPDDNYPGETPVHMTGWSKIYSGFVTPEIVDRNITNLSIRGTSYGDYHLYKIGTGVAGEYFLIENRAPNGYDMGLTSLAGTDSFTGGLSILHVDDTQQDNSNENHKLVDIVEANSAGLDSKADRGHINNLFFSGNADSFTPNTTPNSNRYDGNSTGISITNISEAGSTMSVDININ